MTDASGVSGTLWPRGRLGTVSHSRGTDASEVCKKPCPPWKQRAQGRPGARCTRGLVCNVHKKCAHEHTGPAESIRPSLRNGFTAYGALSPVNGFLVTVAPEKR